MRMRNAFKPNCSCNVHFPAAASVEGSSSLASFFFELDTMENLSSAVVCQLLGKRGFDEDVLQKKQN